MEACMWGINTRRTISFFDSLRKVTALITSSPSSFHGQLYNNHTCQSVVVLAIQQDPTSSQCYPRCDQLRDISLDNALVPLRPPSLRHSQLGAVSKKDLQMQSWVSPRLSNKTASMRKSTWVSVPIVRPT